MKTIRCNGQPPTQNQPHDAGYDLRAAAAATIPARGTATVPTGLSIELPNDCFGLLCSRSGLAAKHSIFVLNSPGIIDAGYRGELIAILANHSDADFHFNPGDRVAQLLVMQHQQVTWQQTDAALSESSRGQQGFGSSGLA